jgi:hypothetical protein
MRPGRDRSRACLPCGAVRGRLFNWPACPYEPGRGADGAWELTLDREARALQTTEAETPYGARLADPDGWLLDGLRHGTFVYLRHMDDEAGAFDFIDLTGSYHAIAEALYWCAPRVAPDEQSDQPGVMPGIYDGETK